jgi:hypothetical protein
MKIISQVIQQIAVQKEGEITVGSNNLDMQKLLNAIDSTQQAKIQKDVWKY